MLECLRERSGAAVSREELLRAVWGTDYGGGSHVVEAVVRSLRGKLGDDAALVETVRGVGYRFVEPWLAAARRCGRARARARVAGRLTRAARTC